MNTDPSPPDDVHLAKVDKNRLTFHWEPVPSVCSDIEYTITAINCGVCPSTTPNTSIACDISNTLAESVNDSLCTFTVQSIVCGILIGNRSNIVQAVLRGRFKLCLIPMETLHAFLVQLQVLLQSEVLCHITQLIQET